MLDTGRAHVRVWLRAAAFAAVAIAMLRFVVYVASYSFPAYPTFRGWLFCVFCVKQLIIIFNCSRSNRYTVVD